MHSREFHAQEQKSMSLSSAVRSWWDPGHLPLRHAVQHPASRASTSTSTDSRFTTRVDVPQVRVYLHFGQQHHLVRRLLGRPAGHRAQPAPFVRAPLFVLELQLTGMTQRGGVHVRQAAVGRAQGLLPGRTCRRAAGGSARGRGRVVAARVGRGAARPAARARIRIASIHHMPTQQTHDITRRPRPSRSPTCTARRARTRAGTTRAGSCARASRGARRGSRVRRRARRARARCAAGGGRAGGARAGRAARAGRCTWPAAGQT
jgi:hypothetical protein